MSTAAVEHLIGRQLHEAERAVDVLGIDAAFNRAKDELHRAIRAEQRRAVRRLWQGDWRIRPEVTRAMLAPLERLHRLGRREALAELRRLGYEPVRLYDDALPEYEQLEPLWQRLRLLVGRLAVRIENERVRLEGFGGVVQEALIDALYRLYGARDVASQVVSSAFTSGLETTFEQNAGAIGGFMYSAILDGNVCSNCAPHDGEEYPSWDAIQVVLPGGGPNPACRGEGRCRCRAVPLPPPR
jgi:hypothetical protein